MGKESACNAGDTGDIDSVLGSGKSARGGNGNPLHYSCLESLMDRGAWWATVQGVAKSPTWLNRNMIHVKKKKKKNKLVLKTVRA